MNGKDRITMNKTFTQDGILPANKLRTLSQKELLEMLETLGKIGLIANNRPEMTILKWERYDEMIDTIEKLSKRVWELENQMDDMFLAEVYGQSVIDAEEGRTKIYSVPEGEDVIEHIERHRKKRKGEKE